MTSTVTNPPMLVGLTGGIGSGKTAVADRFAALGIPLIDTDVIARALTAPGGAALAPIRTAFGDGIVASDGSLDRAAMRALAFSDPGARRRLEAILHPMIAERAEQGIAGAADRGAPYAIVVVPLLVESGRWRDRVDRVLVVDCDEQTQVRRVIARSGLAREQVLAILEAQASRAERLAAADDVIANEGDIGELDARVASLHRQFLSLARG